MRIPGRLPLRALTASLPLLGVASSPARSQTILNVERLQPGDVAGWHWGVEGGFSLSRGNTDKVDVGVGAVLGYRWTRDWLRLFGGLDYLSEDGAKVDNDRYLPSGSTIGSPIAGRRSISCRSSHATRVCSRADSSSAAGCGGV